MSEIARRLKCTEGQLYTVVVGALVAAVLSVVGIPPVMQHQRTATPAAFASPNGQVDASPSSRGEPIPPTAASTPATAEPAENETPEPVTPPQVPSAPPATAGTTTTTTTPSATPTTIPREDLTPRQVIDHGYTSSTAGAPADGVEIPDGGLPVAARAGATDRQSFARLAGEHPVLMLQLVDDQSAHRLVALAAVEACAITELQWELGAGDPPADAPEYDRQRCVPGVQEADGTWHFDLSAIEPLTDAGIALIPVLEGPLTFQITFAARPST